MESLTADVHNGSTATAMVFSGSFSFSYWSYEDSSDGSNFGPRMFDCLNGTDTGLHLSTTSAGALNFRMDDDAGNEVLSKDETNPDPTQADDVWTFVVVNVDRISNQAEIFFNGSSQATYGIAALTGAIVPTQDLEIGVINGGAGDSGIQTAGLDDLAFYDGPLSAQEIANLYSGTIHLRTSTGGPPFLRQPLPPGSPPTPATLPSRSTGTTTASRILLDIASITRPARARFNWWAPRRQVTSPTPA